MALVGVNFQVPTTWISYDPIWYEYNKTVYNLPLDLPDEPTSTNVQYSDTVSGRSVRFAFTTSEANQAEGTVRYLWNFGDGNFSTQQSITHQYSQAGVYKFRVTIYNETGSYSSPLDSVTIS